MFTVYRFGLQRFNVLNSHFSQEQLCYKRYPTCALTIEPRYETTCLRRLQGRLKPACAAIEAR